LSRPHRSIASCTTFCRNCRNRGSVASDPEGFNGEGVGTVTWTLGVSMPSVLARRSDSLSIRSMASKAAPSSGIGVSPGKDIHPVQ
jgi:hypothetical protein